MTLGEFMPKILIEYEPEPTIFSCYEINNFEDGVHVESTNGRFLKKYYAWN